MIKIRIKVIRTKKELRKYQDKYNIAVDDYIDSYGLSWHLDNLHIVYIAKDLKKKVLYSTIAHEALHICQSYFSNIGEGKPGDEIYATFLHTVYEKIYRKL